MDCGRRPHLPKIYTQSDPIWVAWRGHAYFWVLLCSAHIPNLKCVRWSATKKWNATPNVKILVLSHPLGELGNTQDSSMARWKARSVAPAVSARLQNGRGRRCFYLAQYKYLMDETHDMYLLTSLIILPPRRKLCAGNSHHRVYVCLCVCLSVCLSYAGIVSKRLNVGSRKQHHVIAQGL